jgi:hypothetical protein
VILLRVLPKFNVGSEPDWDLASADDRQLVNKVNNNFKAAVCEIIEDPSAYIYHEIVAINTVMEGRRGISRLCPSGSSAVVSFGCMAPGCNAIPTCHCTQCGFARFCSETCKTAAAGNTHNDAMCWAYKACERVVTRSDTFM